MPRYHPGPATLGRVAAHGEEREDVSAGLRRVLGPVDATCVVVGAIIGVGIFFTPGQVATLAGSKELALAAWALGGAIAMLGALSFAELGGLYPRSGGQYEVLRDAYGAPAAFMFVFCNATAVQAGATAIIGTVCAQNLGIAAGASPSDAAVTSGALVLILGLMAANVMGVRWGSSIQNATVFAKVATLAAVTAVAAAHGDAGAAGAGEAAAAAGRRAGPGGAAAVGAALVPVLFAFGGWQQALWIAGEVRRPRRDVPLAIVAGVLIVVAAYLAVNWAYLKLLGHSGVAGSDAIAADAIASVWPVPGRRIAAAAVAISAFGVLNAQLLAGPRLVFGMARDGRFFGIFGRASPRFGTPVAAIALIGLAAVTLLVCAGPRTTDRLLAGVVLVDGFFFALTGAAVIVLRRRMRDAPRPVRVPGYPVVPGLFVAAEVAVLAAAALEPATRRAAVFGAVWILIAAGFYAAFFRGGRPRKAAGAA